MSRTEPNRSVSYQPTVPFASARAASRGGPIGKMPEFWMQTCDSDDEDIDYKEELLDHVLKSGGKVAHLWSLLISEGDRDQEQSRRGSLCGPSTKGHCRV